MICKLVYNEKYESFKKDLEALCANNQIQFEGYDENYYKDKRKSITIKAGCGTKITPFVAFYNDKELIKAFYMDDNSCTIKHITEWLLN
jgi:hypothetical protein|nr:MAG TPA: hypothetical protein [Caudoviricetes sp.]